jgi:hypothetical protein
MKINMFFNSDLQSIYVHFLGDCNEVITWYQWILNVKNRMINFRIRKFLGLPDPDPLIGGVDPDSDPSIFKQK